MKATLSLFPTAILEPETMQAMRSVKRSTNPPQQAQRPVDANLRAFLPKCTDVPARFGLHQETKKNG
jgi:hypothetical protein